MKSWLEFEHRFRALSGSLGYYRLESQWGAAGEHWHLSGGNPTPKTQQFELLSALAGEKLLVVLRAEDEITTDLLNEPDHRIRWYKALKFWSGHFTNDLYGYQTDVKGEFSGHIFSGSLKELPENSANVCLALQTRFPIPEKSMLQRMWDEYGSKVIVGLILAVAAALIKLWIG